METLAYFLTDAANTSFSIPAISMKSVANVIGSFTVTGFVGFTSSVSLPVFSEVLF